MYQRDYLLRLIEQMTEALGTIMQLRQQKKFEEAGESVDGLLHRLGLPGRQVLGALAAEEIERLLEVNGEVQADKLLVAARQLREEADVRAEAGHKSEAYFTYVKALRLTASGIRQLAGGTANPASLPEDSIQDAVTLRERLQGERLPPVAAREAALLFESLGRYDLAENYWFEAAGTAGEAGEEAMFIREGEAFFERLLRLDDATLERGALPREEAKEGLADFRQKFRG
ncbi:DUF6483 family protein [Paenibacillus sp. TRM 82003]|nr:DUF6483 family protein [Paenibacillus sp. TRM 82003]